MVAVGSSAGGVLVGGLLDMFCRWYGWRNGWRNVWWSRWWAAMCFIGGCGGHVLVVVLVRPC